MRKRDFTQIPNPLIKDGGISDGAFRTLMALKSFDFGKKAPFPSQGTLAKIRNKSKKTINEHLKELKAKGLITYKRRGFSSSNQYNFIYEENVINEEKGNSNVTETSFKKSQKLQPNNTNSENTKLRISKEISYKKENKRELTNDELRLLENIVKWNTISDFNTLISEKVIRLQVTHTIQKYGYEVVKKIFERTANTFKPHPRDFWNEIKGLKEATKQ